MFERAYLGGDLIETLGSVRGRPGMGVTADLQKATGEIRVHLVQPKRDEPAVVVELPQAEVPGDSAAMATVRLPAGDAVRLAELLFSAAWRARQADRSG